MSDGYKPPVTLEVTGKTAPQAVTAHFQCFADLGAPPFVTAGVDLLVMLPGGLEPVARIPLPPGGTLWYLPPEMSAQVRPHLIAQVKREMELRAKLAHEAGRDGSVRG